MLLNDEYKIERMSDGLNVCLYKESTIKTGPRTGQTEWVNQGKYWGTFEKAFRGAINIIGINKITYQGDIDAVLEELSRVARMIDRVSEDVSKMPPIDFCVGCPKRKAKNGK